MKKKKIAEDWNAIPNKRAFFFPKTLISLPSIIDEINAATEYPERINPVHVEETSFSLAKGGRYGATTLNTEDDNTFASKSATRVPVFAIIYYKNLNYFNKLTSSHLIQNSIKIRCHI